jgi:hypothetical protein
MLKNLVVVALVVPFVLTSAKAGTLAGTVRDSEGAAIAKAHVVIHWDSSGSNYLKDNIGIKEDVTATTDANGEFSVDLPPGFYDVFVAAISFSPHCDKVRVKAAATQRYAVRLKVSPVTSKELD